MASAIYAITGDGELIEMSSSSFESEDLLQTMIERYPQILAGEQISPDNPRRWILVLREAGIPDADDACSRWSVDHLLVDQDGVPTLVEVKRSSDTRIRREVVGQMLDYAANAIAYWPVDDLRSWFESRCEAEGVDPFVAVAALCEDDDYDRYWLKVKTNLQARRLRLVFVADSIPKELRRIIEFLNEQMDPAEVIGIELSRYRGESGLEALVPRVIGQTSGSETRKTVASSRGPTWTPERFFNDLREKDGAASVRVAGAMLRWAEENASRVWWGRGKTMGSFLPVFSGPKYEAVPFSVWSYGRVELNFQHLRDKAPFTTAQERRVLAQRIMDTVGIDIPAESQDKRPSFRIGLLEGESCREAFLGIMKDAGTAVAG